MSAPAISLRRVADVRASNVDKKSDPDDLPVRLVNYTDVYYRDRLTADLELMPATASPEQVARFRLLAGDTIITKDSETAADIAVPAFVQSSAEDMVCGYHLSILRPHADRIDPRFLFWAVSSRSAREQFTVGANGMTRYGLSYDAIRSVKVPVPSLEEQRRIADFLDDQVARIDRIVDTRRQQAELLVAHTRSEIDNFIESDASEFGWMPLRRITAGIEQGWSPQCDNVPAGEGEFGVLKLSSVRAGAFLPSENKAMLEGVEPAWRYQLRTGDLLVSRANTPELVGDSAVVDREYPTLFLCDLLYRIRLTFAESSYVCAAIRTERVRGLLRSLGRGTSLSMAKIRGDDIMDLPLPRAPERVRIGRQEQLAAVEDRATRGRAILASSIALLSAMKRSLITAAVSGEFDVSSASGRGVPS